MNNKLLYLVQHGEAYSKEENPDRPLTEKGKEIIRKIGNFLNNNRVVIDAFWHSPKTRAKETAHILREELQLNSSPITEYKELEPEENPSKTLKEIKKSGYNAIMIVGHLPHLSKLSGLLLCNDKDADIINFEKGCVVCIEWNEETGGILKWMIIPSLLNS